MGRTSQRLLARLRAEAPFVIPAGSEPERLHHGRHQRSAGAWSWSIDLGSHLAGSQWSMRECVGALRLDFDKDRSGDWHVDPIVRASGSVTTSS